MGRIKSLMVKKAARQLLDERTIDLFGEDFDANQKALRSTMPSKPLGNKIAGYITRLMKFKAEKQKAEELKRKELEAKQIQA